MKYYVRSSLRSWEGALEPSKNNVWPVPVSVDGGKSCGFLEVYESLEALREEHPSGGYFTLEAMT